MYQKIGLWTVVPIIVLVSAETVKAESVQPFISVKGGYQVAADETYNSNRPTGGIIGLGGGLRLTPEWSWDIGYQYNEELNANATNVDVDTWLIDSALRYDWYLNDRLSLYGRFGAVYWDMDKTTRWSSKGAAGFSPVGEFGVNYHVSQKLRFSSSYQYINAIGDSNTGEYDSHALLLGLSYSFGINNKIEHSSSPLVIEEIVDDASNEPVHKSSSSVVEEIVDHVSKEPVHTPSPSVIEETVDVVSNEPVQKTAKRQVFVFSEHTLGEDFSFNSGSTYIGKSFKETLAQVATVLNNNPKSKVHIIGHTDSIGSFDYNQALSEKRAKAVADELLHLGVNDSQIQSEGKGEAIPIQTNSTKMGRAQNRRVELIIRSFEY